MGLIIDEWWWSMVGVTLMEGADEICLFKE